MGPAYRAIRRRATRGRLDRRLRDGRLGRGRGRAADLRRVFEGVHGTLGFPRRQRGAGGRRSRGSLRTAGSCSRFWRDARRLAARRRRSDLESAGRRRRTGGRDRGNARYRAGRGAFGHRLETCRRCRDRNRRHLIPDEREHRAIPPARRRPSADRQRETQLSLGEIRWPFRDARRRRGKPAPVPARNQQRRIPVQPSKQAGAVAGVMPVFALDVLLGDRGERPRGLA